MEWERCSPLLRFPIAISYSLSPVFVFASLSCLWCADYRRAELEREGVEVEAGPSEVREERSSGQKERRLPTRSRKGKEKEVIVISSSPVAKK
jgi:hypothetical protein